MKKLLFALCLLGLFACKSKKKVSVEQPTPSSADTLSSSWNGLQDKIEASDWQMQEVK